MLKHKFLSTLVLIAVLLTACGGGQASPTAAPTAAPGETTAPEATTGPEATATVALKKCRGTRRSTWAGVLRRPSAPPTPGPPGIPIKKVTP